MESRHLKTPHQTFLRNNQWAEGVSKAEQISSHSHGNGATLKKNIHWSSDINVNWSSFFIVTVLSSPKWNACTIWTVYKISLLMSSVALCVWHSPNPRDAVTSSIWQKRHLSRQWDNDLRTVPKHIPKITYTTILKAKHQLIFLNSNNFLKEGLAISFDATRLTLNKESLQSLFTTGSFTCLPLETPCRKPYKETLD